MKAIRDRPFRVALAACLLGFGLTASRSAVAEEASHGHRDTGAAKLVDGPALQVEVFADQSQVKNVTALCIDDHGRLYVTESHRWRNGVEDNRDHLYWLMDDIASQTVADRAALIEKWKSKFADDYFTRETERVIRLTDTDDDGRADERAVFAEDFDEPVDGPAIGLLAGLSPGKIYLACIPHLWVLEDTDGDGQADLRESLQSGFGPRFSLSGHDLHGLTRGPDGRLYFSVGDRGYHLETKDGSLLSAAGSGAVFRCRPDGTEMEVFCTGLRNPQELAFNEFGDLFTVDNNADQGDAARVCYLLEGSDAGWHMGHQILTTFSDQVEDGGMDQEPHWLSEGLWKLRFDGQPAWILPPIAHLTDGPSGLVFNAGTSLGPRYRNHFLVCDYKGSSSQCFLHSFRVRRTDAGYVMEDDHIFHQGITASDVDIGYDGKIYVADFGGGWTRPDRGNVFALYDKEAVANPVVAETESLFAEGFAELPAERLRELLSHPDQRVRLRSQFTLAVREEPAATLFREVAQDTSADLLARVHALWGLGQLEAGDALTAFLADPDDELRAQAARLVGELRHLEAGESLTALLRDKNPRVRAFAAMALGKLDHGLALPEILEMIAENADRDVFLRHAGIMALRGAARPDYLAGLREHPSRSVRLAALLALRKLEHPDIVVYLRDPDSEIVHECIRAINDLPLEEARRKLADYSRRFMLPDFTDALPNEPVFRRLINANFRLADPKAAQRLMLFGMNASLPEAYRLASLHALSLWPEPPPVDPTLGRVLPLEKRHLEEAVRIIQEDIVDMLQAATESAYIETGLRVVDAFEIPLKPGLLYEWLMTPRLSVACRTAALNRFIENPPRLFNRTLETLLRDTDPEMRVAAAKATVTLDPSAARRMAYFLLQEGKTVVESRGAYAILGASEAEGCAELLATEVQKLGSRRIDPQARLDLYEAAASRSEPEVVQAVASVTAQLGPNGVFAYTLTGGDPKRGKAIFANQGTCLKCHEVDGPGGDAGPSLAGVASRLTQNKLIESIINPNAEIVPGYGITTVTLNDGTTLTGAPLEEDASSLLLKTAHQTPERIPKDTIASRTPVVSAMPPMGLALPKKDVRDLMSYLNTLR